MTVTAVLVIPRNTSQAHCFPIQYTRTPYIAQHETDTFRSQSQRMGRYADGVSGLHCGGGVELCVMSSHLESFIGKDDTSSGERVAQMQDVFRTLDGIVERRVNDRKKASGDVFPTGVQNALFAGDTNWDEKSDGEVPLDRKNGWVDAWCEKGDGGPGYTYDLRRNQMMSGWLQKRLDRVFCRYGRTGLSQIQARRLPPRS